MREGNGLKWFIIIVLFILALLFNKIIWESDMPFWLKFTLTK